MPSLNQALKRRLTLTFVAAFGITTSSCASAQSLAQQPNLDFWGSSSLFSFGDSLSDTGNIARLTRNRIPKAAEYYRSSFSNGAVWVDILAANLEIAPGLVKVSDTSATNGINFAHGGAVTGVQARDLPRPVSLNEQALFFTGMATSGTLVVKSADLFTIWAGANDYLGNEGAEPSFVVRNIDRAIRDLAAAGAQRILIVNLPDLSITPFARNNGEAVSRRLAEQTREHNFLLAAAVRQLRIDIPGVQFSELDVNRIFDDLLKNPARFGFSVVDRDCLENELVLDDCPADWLFYDRVHPTFAAHQLIALYALEALGEDD